MILHSRRARCYVAEQVLETQGRVISRQLPSAVWLICTGTWIARHFLTVAANILVPTLLQASLASGGYACSNRTNQYSACPRRPRKPF